MWEAAFPRRSLRLHCYFDDLGADIHRKAIPAQSLLQRGNVACDVPNGGYSNLAQHEDEGRPGQLQGRKRALHPLSSEQARRGRHWPGTCLSHFTNHLTDGQQSRRLGTTPVLIETFVETPRSTGAVYRASGWLPVCTSQGRGCYDRQEQFDTPREGRLASAPAQRLETHTERYDYFLNFNVLCPYSKCHRRDRSLCFTTFGHCCAAASVGQPRGSVVCAGMGTAHAL